MESDFVSKTYDPTRLDSESNWTDSTTLTKCTIIITSSEFPASGNKNSHEPFLVEQYQRQFMDTSETEYNTAPAAYGVYNTSDLYHPLDHIDPAMLDQAPYQMSPYAASMNSFDESVTTGNHAGGISLQQVDGSCFQNDSSQSSTNNIEYYIRTPVSKKSRKAAEPITLINNSKLDRRTLKRMRNRVSASRCRSKKKEWITDMEETNSLLHEENIMLQERVDELHELIAATKRRLSEQANGKRE